MSRPRAWLHTVRVLNGDAGEQDEALSFDPISFPLGDAGLFESIASHPLYGQEDIDAAVAEERERCAKLVETQDPCGDYGVRHWFEYLAAKIRSK